MTPRAVATAALLVALAGCAPRWAGGDPCLCPAPMRETQLFFGLSRASGIAVSDAEWRAFLAEVVTPRFPRGLTVLDAEGQYTPRAAADVRRERTRIVVLLHGGDHAADTAIDEIMRDYRRRFDQESVLRVDTAAAVSF